MILDDPVGNSYIQSLEDDDPQLKVEEYERTWEQNEAFGLNDVKTEGYENDNNDEHNEKEKQHPVTTTTTTTTSAPTTTTTTSAPTTTTTSTTTQNSNK